MNQYFLDVNKKQTLIWVSEECAVQFPEVNKERT